jgi:hypothetical protein
MLWALPCSVIGIALGVIVLLLDGRWQRVGHTLEIALAVRQSQLPRWATQLRFSAITFGHVIVGQSHEALAALRSHERVHVRQYERLGVLFLLAYPAASLLAACRGQCPYMGNRFEREAYAASSADTPAG